jgi:hypothetical protein
MFVDTPYGQLPAPTINGDVRPSQSRVIENYLARQFSKYKKPNVGIYKCNDNFDRGSSCLCFWIILKLCSKQTAEETGTSSVG